MDTVRVVGASFFDALRNYADHVNEIANEATQVALDHVQTRLQDQARSSAAWQEIAEHITVFSQDGRRVVGIPNGETLSQAQDAEFGTDTTPPTPIFRTSQGVAQEAKAKAQHYMNARLGPAPL